MNLFEATDREVRVLFDETEFEIDDSESLPLDQEYLAPGYVWGP
jgi:hypothetical protein